MAEQKQSKNNTPSGENKNINGSKRNAIKVPKQTAVISSNSNSLNAKSSKPTSAKKADKNKTTNKQTKIKKNLKASNNTKKEKATKTIKESESFKEATKSKDNLYIKEKEKQFALDDINELEKRLLQTKERKDEKKKRIIIIILSIMLIAMISAGSWTAVKIIDNRKIEPAKVDIVLETLGEGLQGTPIDPDNPDAGYIRKVMYPGDSVELDFSVYTEQLLEGGNFPVYIRYRVYIEIDGNPEHNIFMSHFTDEEKWHYWVDEEGNDLEIDDWFYYGGALQIGVEHKLKIIDGLTFRTDIGNEYQGKDFEVKLEIQAVQGQEEAVGDFEEWWKAPDSWYDYMDENNWFN